jgi:hypothetical protein
LKRIVIGDSAVDDTPIFAVYVDDFDSDAMCPRPPGSSSSITVYVFTVRNLSASRAVGRPVVVMSVVLQHDLISLFATKSSMKYSRGIVVVATV